PRPSKSGASTFSLAPLRCAALSGSGVRAARACLCAPGRAAPEQVGRVNVFPRPAPLRCAFRLGGCALRAPVCARAWSCRARASRARQRFPSPRSAALRCDLAGVRRGLLPDGDVLRAVARERLTPPAAPTSAQRQAGDPGHQVELSRPDVTEGPGRAFEAPACGVEVV